MGSLALPPTHTHIMCGLDCTDMDLIIRGKCKIIGHRHLQLMKQLQGNEALYRDMMP